MKLQLHAQTLRWRIDEAELSTLLDVGVVASCTRLPGIEFAQQLALDEGDAARLEADPGGWYLRLPRAAVLAHAERLPCRDAQEFHVETGVGDALRVLFEVDVRDSVRMRRARDQPAASMRPSLSTNT